MLHVLTIYYDSQNKKIFQVSSKDFYERNITFQFNNFAFEITI